MVQRGEHLRLTLEAREAIGIRREELRQNLERDITPQLGISRAIDLPLSHRRRGRSESRTGRVWCQRKESRFFSNSQRGNSVDYTARA
jgi:hypothetical protein